MKKASIVFTSLLNVLMVISLASMSLLVFTNVVLRYIFNTGIAWSEEMSRFLFIWMVFFGAIGSLKDNQHLGVDMLVRRLSPKLKKAVYVLSNLLILFPLYLLFEGSWKTALFNLHTKAPATGLSLSLVYGIGIVTSVGMAIVLLINLFHSLLANNDSQDNPAEITTNAELQSEAAQGGGGK